ncbi:hypothetical protein BU17DRAFT_74148 [Hysterangium stoloniferum]|nr:hypothetical protein BU17DRAFT_74148 [Hysterangium stoloniferum]
MYPIVAVALAVVGSAVAQDTTPLADKRIPYNQIPYMVDTNNGPRGIQTGYNQCNSTTQGQTSLCQTAIVNSIDDFCIWGPQKPNSSIADTEGELVAWCTQPGHGTRVIPPNALTGVQFMQTPDYVQVTGRIDQVLINIADGDSGGEEDPHGADGRGNPLGSLIYSNAFPASGGDKTKLIQVIEWHNFLGGDIFCMKVCDPAGANAAHFCEHIFDRIGCMYNAPAAYQNGTFESCKGDNQDFPGVYTGSDGQVSTYSQPPESLGVISSMPYQPKTPASSQCTTFTSAQLYASAASLFPSSTTPSPTGGSSSGTRSGSGVGSTATGSSGNGTSSNGAGRAALCGGVLVAAAGVLGAVLVV